jgi:hypothetical protein
MKSVPTVYDIRKTGVKVTVNHHRLFYKFDPRTGYKFKKIMNWDLQTESYSDYFLSASGGRTIVTITDKDGSVFVGECECSETDPYVKKFGTTKALARALAKFNHR